MVDLDPRKVAFISCVNDEELHQRCVSYLDRLEVPPCFTVERRFIRGAHGMPSAYNQAMRESDAKYKVYLHQDTFIHNRRLIGDIVDLFSAHPHLGMIGVVGGSRLPKSGIWFEDGLHSFGKVREYRASGMKLFGLGNQRKERLVRFRPVRQPYRPVLVIDGLIMITQYDLAWREDLYDSFLYYEGPHSLEFIKAGYQVGVIHQRSPWCTHWGPLEDRGPEEHTRMWRGIRANAEIFVIEYSRFIGKNSINKQTQV